MKSKFAFLVVAIGSVAGCGAEEEDLALSDESRVLSSYLQAVTCISLQTSDAEKKRLVAGMPYLDGSTTPATDLKAAIMLSINAEHYLFELLPQKCPESSRSISFWSQQVDARTAGILKHHFVDLVVLTLAIQVSPRDDLRKYFENSYTPIGTSRPRY